MCLCCRELLLEDQTAVLKLVQEEAQKMGKNYSKPKHKTKKKGKYHSYILLKCIQL